ncbi:MAG: nuclear transport factor 2 family protein [Dehalococcoidales bacterium]|nr:nuclear transport factor 2 family protein [Dehalococcoidales bacterium]
MTTESVESRLAKLEKLVEEQQKKIAQQEDIEAIRRLQYAYNYYVEHMLGEDIIDCFADDPDTKLNWLEGQYCGKEGVRRYFEKAAKGENPVGFSHQLMPNTGLITLNPDGKTAQGRWYVFGGVYTPDENGEVKGGALVSGVYEMTYIKEDGIWKILQIYWFIPYSARITEWGQPEGVGRMIIEGSRKADDDSAEGFRFPKPDIPIDENDLRYVSGFILPHHFVHPVTGKPSTEARHNARLSPLKLD